MDPMYQERERESGQPVYPSFATNGQGKLNGFSYKRTNPETGEQENCLVIGEKTTCTGTGVYPEGKKEALPKPPLPGTSQQPTAVVQPRKERTWLMPLLGGVGLGFGLGFVASYFIRR